MEWNAVERAITTEIDARTEYKGVGKLCWFTSRDGEPAGMWSTAKQNSQVSPSDLLCFTCPQGTWPPLCGSRLQLCGAQWPAHCWPHQYELSSPPRVERCECHQMWLPGARGTCSAYVVGSLPHLHITYCNECTGCAYEAGAVQCLHITHCNQHTAKLVSQLVFWTRSTKNDYIRAKNNVQPVSYLLCTSVIKPWVIKTHKISPDTNFKKKIYTNIRHKIFEELVPPVLPQLKKAQKARTCWYRGPVRQFINTRFFKK